MALASLYSGLKSPIPKSFTSNKAPASLLNIRVTIALLVTVAPIGVPKLELRNEKRVNPYMFIPLSP